MASVSTTPQKILPQEKPQPKLVALGGALYQFVLQGFAHLVFFAVKFRCLGLEPQQYVLLLTLRGLPSGVQPTIHTLAERLGLKHNTTVELIDRMAKRGYVARNRSRDDRRYVIVSPLPRGEKLLEQVARQRLTELRAGGEALVDALHALLGQKWKSRSKGSRR